MGRTTLASSKNTRGETVSNTGYFGDDFKTVRDIKLLPEWLKRNSPGTDIHIVGFKEPTYWAELVAASILTNFFAAIFRNTLLVKIILMMENCYMR